MFHRRCLRILLRRDYGQNSKRNSDPKRRADAYSRRHPAGDRDPHARAYTNSYSHPDAGPHADGDANTDACRIQDHRRDDYSASGAHRDLLANGTVLMTGGMDVHNQTIASAELYNPATGRFSATGTMNVARVFHTATLLANGQVLVVGGEGVTDRAQNTAELYNPSQWQVYFYGQADGASPGAQRDVAVQRAGAGGRRR